MWYTGSFAAAAFGTMTRYYTTTCFVCIIHAILFALTKMFISAKFMFIFKFNQKPFVRRGMEDALALVYFTFKKDY